MALLLSLLNTKIAIVASSIKTSSAAELAKALCEVELEKLTTDVVEKLLTLCPVSEAEVKQCREYVRAPPRELGGGTLGHLHPRGSAGPGTCILQCGAGVVRGRYTGDVDKLDRAERFLFDLSKISGLSNARTRASAARAPPREQHAHVCGGGGAGGRGADAP